MFGQPLGEGLLLVHAGVPYFRPHLCAPLRPQASWVLVSLTPSFHCSALVLYPPCFPHLKGGHSSVPGPQRLFPGLLLSHPSSRVIRRQRVHLCQPCPWPPDLRPLQPCQ